MQSKPFPFTHIETKIPYLEGMHCRLCDPQMCGHQPPQKCLSFWQPKIGSKFTTEMQQWVVTAISAIPSGLEVSGGKQNADKLQKLVWSTAYPNCKFNSNCYKCARALQKWCRAVALISQATGEISWQQAAGLQPEGQQYNLNIRDRESYWVWVMILSGIYQLQQLEIQQALERKSLLFFFSSLLMIWLKHKYGYKAATLKSWVKVS